MDTIVIIIRNQGNVMKKQYLVLSLAAMLLFVGCGSKEPVVDETASQKEVKSVQDDTANAATSSSDDATITGESDAASSKDANELHMESVEGKVESVYFDFDKFFIRADMQEKVENNAKVLTHKDSKGYRISIEGNCDEWGTDEYNYALGLKRASSAKKALVGQGVDAQRITLVSYGEANPVCTEKSQECWSKNRRADFKVRP